MKQCHSATLPSLKNKNDNGIQVLPILWRKDILFGMANDSEEGETDIGMRCTDDGCPTLDEITLDGAPMYRTLVSDVFLDIPLYMTQKYREQMTIVITNEINRVYNLFIQRHPEFLKNNGKVSILGHSLGSLLAFDILSTQPMTPLQESFAKPNDKLPSSLEKKIPSLSFKVDNFFAIGSPLGLFLLLRGFKISSRKALSHGNVTDWNETSANIITDHHAASIPYYYPAVENLYNIFHRSDPVAYRLEPLISRHYGINEKPVAIPYIKGGLKGVLDAGYTVGTDIANRANAMLDSFRSSWTNSIIMRGWGLTKAEQQQQQNENSTSDVPVEMKKLDPKSTGAKKLTMLNPKTNRVDFCLQEGILENAYVSALSVHMNYWADLDVAAMLIREIYKE
ncbi:DDHD domain-containing protein [Cunninghamella echinulata]|nr:DDHD domain-containing protein [Cunninghamella echinulata]